MHTEEVSPRPWRAIYDGSRHCIVSADNCEIAQFNTLAEDHDVHLAVRAVNSHEALVAIVTEICCDARECEMDEGPSMVDGITWDHIVRLHAALKLAEG